MVGLKAKINLRNNNIDLTKIFRKEYVVLTSLPNQADDYTDIPVFKRGCLEVEVPTSESAGEVLPALVELLNSARRLGIDVVLNLNGARYPVE